MSLSKPYTFITAKPVWQKNQVFEMNHSLIFRGIVDKGEGIGLCITGAAKYQIFINGAFFAEGPARAGHGYFRVDEFLLDNALTMKDNCVCVIAAGYNCNSFYLTDEPSFLCAEIVKNGEILYATGSEREFEVIEFSSRVKKVQRFSFQRPFAESYNLDGCWDVFFNDPSLVYPNVPLVLCPGKKFIERGVPYADYTPRQAKTSLCRGICLPRAEKKPYTDRSYLEVGEKLKGFLPAELWADNTKEVLAYEPCVKSREVFAFAPVNIDTNCFEVFDMGINTTGFIRLSFTALHDTVIYAVFDEKTDENGVPKAGSNGCANIVSFSVQGGRAYDLVSFEPYTYRYIQIISLYAPVLLTNVSQYTDGYDRKKLTGLKKMKDEELQKIYDAAVETFCQNTLDIFMDCPSRERAGWLCDSFFTSRVAYALTGDTCVERNFLENFLQPSSFRCLPEGMLPMCYPADHYDGVYIPNWAMWYGLELREYFDRSNDRELIDKAEEKMTKLTAFFEKYENADGLLQKLDSWVFVEWSKANDFTQDINYPTNMLYAAFLSAVGELYHKEAWLKKGEKIRQVIREKAFDGEFFVDNALINEKGEAENTGNHTETCQYYAFFTGVADKERYPGLWEKLRDTFGAGRDAEKTYPDVPVSNAFVGNYLRLELLFRDGDWEKCETQIRAFFTGMAQATGTLWENMSPGASCCHGFASHVAYWLNNMVQENKIFVKFWRN